MNDTRVMDPEDWPDDDSEHILYGEDNVLRMCQRFNLEERKAVRGFKIFKDGSEKRVYPSDS